MTAQTETPAEEQAATSAEGQTETSAADGGSFTKIRSLGPHGAEAAGALDQACAALRAEGVTQGIARLKRVDEFVDQLDFPSLERLVDPARMVEEFSAARSRRVHSLHSVRNSIVVAPLVVTWLALAWASIDYSGELAHHPLRVTKPFLLLWQQRFGGKPILTFAQFGFVDLVLLSAVLACTVWVQHEERRLMKRQVRIVETIDAAMGQLAVAISRGVARPPASAQEWADSARRIISDAMEETRRLATAGQEAIEQASKNLAAAHTEEREFIKTFSTTIAEALDSAREEYQQFMRKVALEVSDIIEQQMNPLLGKFDGLVTKFGEHHETYRDGVAKLTEGVGKMSLSAETLAASASDHARVGTEIGANLAKVADSQRDFADQVTKNVANMAGAAKAMEETADVLRKEMLSGLKEVSANIAAASRDLKTTQGHLTTTTSALDTSTTALVDVTRELRAAAVALGSGMPSHQTFWGWVMSVFRR